MPTPNATPFPSKILVFQSIYLIRLKFPYSHWNLNYAIIF